MSDKLLNIVITIILIYLLKEPIGAVSKVMPILKNFFFKITFKYLFIIIVGDGNAGLFCLQLDLKPCLELAGHRPHLPHKPFIIIRCH